MFQSRKIPAAAALALGVVLAGGALSGLNMSVRAQTGDATVGTPAQRIAAAFASAEGGNDDRALAEAAVRSQKGDMLARPGCADQQWPNIAPDCLVTADGSSPRAVRYVTIGHQSGEAATVLVRMPALLVASR